MPNRSNNTTFHIAVSCSELSEKLRQKACLLARELDLELVDFTTSNADFLLNVENRGLTLHQRCGITPPKPLYIDFTHGTPAYRHIKENTIKQPMARAVGIKSGFRPLILDATAGCGQDSFVFASLGCPVILCERSPILWALVEDALGRGRHYPGSIGEALLRMSLYRGNAAELLSEFSEKPHTIYFDPMYPHSSKSALHKKEMRIIRALVGNDDDAAEVFNELRHHATNRVVVKRPKGAETIDSSSPSHIITMKNSRFDVYLRAHL